MEFIPSTDGREGVEKMAGEIAAHLKENEKVLWLVCGGSNIPLAAEAMKIILQSVPVEQIENLTVGQTDERYGPVGHKDSNWKQMEDAGFDFAYVQPLAVLLGEDLDTTVLEYERRIREAFAEADTVIAQFGIGADGHVAGMLPHTGGIEAKELVFGYDSPPFVRITITPQVFQKIDAAFAFAFGESKREAIEKLQKENLPLPEEPCQILKTIPESYFYSDRL